MKRFSWKIYIPLILFVMVAAYWNFVVYQKKEEFFRFCQPFLAACQTPSGCILVPEGWERSHEDWYSNNLMMYRATKNEFKLTWHIATDVYLVATGGKDLPLVIERDVN